MKLCTNQLTDIHRPKKKKAKDFAIFLRSRANTNRCVKQSHTIPCLAATAVYNLFIGNTMLTSCNVNNRKQIAIKRNLPVTKPREPD